jgi:predicted dinucleotide-binding enzyme
MSGLIVISSPRTGRISSIVGGCQRTNISWGANDLFGESGMRIAVIGAGNVGATLGRRWAGTGHEVTFGVRDPAAPKHRVLTGQARVAGVAAAAAGADIVVLATPWSATEAAIGSAGDLGGKILVDCTNPLKPDLSGLTHGHETSGGEQVARWAPGARVVKAFNTVGFNIMANPELQGRRAVMYVASDDAQARRIVAQLADDLGFESVEAGGLASARLLEPFALLWISSAYRFGLGREFAFSLVRRAGE